MFDITIINMGSKNSSRKLCALCYLICSHIYQCT